MKIFVKNIFSFFMLLSCFAKKVTKEGNKGEGFRFPSPLTPSLKRPKAFPLWNLPAVSFGYRRPVGVFCERPRKNKRKAVYIEPSPVGEGVVPPINEG